MAKQPKKAAYSSMTDDTSPIGALPDGRINIVDKDDPPFKPTIVDDDGNEIEPGED